MHRPAIVFLAVILLDALSACSSQQLYASGQGYQRNQCERLPDMGERQRCLEKANMSHDEYMRETKAEGK